MDFITLQVAPRGIIPYFTLVERAHTINESNNFGVFFVKTCTMEVIKVVNLVLLKQSTDGISCDTNWDFTTTMKYLRGNINHILFPETNHNVKKICYKLVGESCEAVIFW